MSRPQTRLHTPQGTLLVNDQEVRMERGPLRKAHRTIPRDRITHIRLTSRFHALPLVLGGLLLASAGALTLIAGLVEGPSLGRVLLSSLLLALLVAGLFSLLALPLALRAELLIGAGRDEIKVRTGYHRRARLEQIHALLIEPPESSRDLARGSMPEIRSSRFSRSSG